MKYIMLQHHMIGIAQVIPIIFPNNLVHSDVAIAIRDALYKHYPDIAIIRAGDINIADCTTSGLSDTLKLKSSEEDGNTILGYDYFCGLVDL